MKKQKSSFEEVVGGDDQHGDVLQDVKVPQGLDCVVADDLVVIVVVVVVVVVNNKHKHNGGSYHEQVVHGEVQEAGFGGELDAVVEDDVAWEEVGHKDSQPGSKVCQQCLFQD